MAAIRLRWSLYGVPVLLGNHDTLEVYWELQEFLVLALKANPRGLDSRYTLYTPLVEQAMPLGRNCSRLRAFFCRACRMRSGRAGGARNP